MPRDLASWSAAVALLAAGLLHALPAFGLAGASRLAQLYGVDATDPNLLLLLRHRAVLFALLAGACVLAAFRPAWHAPVLWIALASTAGFVVLGWGVSINAALARVVRIDIVASVLLAVALALHYLPKRG